MPPPVPKTANTAPAPAAPVSSTPTASPVAGGAAPAGAAPESTAKKSAEKFGPGGRGDIAAIPVPTVNGVDLGTLNDVLYNALLAIPAIGNADNLSALVSAIDGVPKSQFPGNKHGRAAWNLGNVVKTVLKIKTGASKSRRSADGTPKVRKTAKAKLQNALGQLASKLGKDKLAELLGADFDVAKLLEDKAKAAEANTAAAPAA